jgi:hypothetical protein
MSASQRVSRGFHRLGVFLGAITLLVAGMMLFGPTQASRANPIAQTRPVEVRPEAPYAWAVKGTQYALELKLKGESEKGAEEYKYRKGTEGSESPHNFDKPNVPNNGIAAGAKKDLDVLPGHDGEHHSKHPICWHWEERFDIDKGVTERRCVDEH